MACRFEVTVPVWHQAAVQTARKALDEVDRLEQQLSVFREESEISYLNRNAANASVTLESSLFQLLCECHQLWVQTEGAFDITAGPLTRCWGFLRREGKLPHPDELKRAKEVVGSDRLLFDPEARSVRFKSTGVEINLGSIGKGYALDRVTASITSQLPTALLNAGASSMRAIGGGELGGRGWPVGLRHPRNKNRRLARLRIRNCALSTSGSEEQFFEHGGKRYGHIIDPRTGWPAGTVTSVTVVAQSAAISDALATAFYVGGRELAERYCCNHPNVLAIMLETDSETPVVIGANRGCVVEQCVKEEG